MSAALKAARDEAWQAFESLGLPTVHDEDWKYTDLSRITSLLGESWWKAPATAATDVPSVEIPGLDAYHILFVNGVFDEHASNLPVEVAVTPLAALIQDEPSRAVELVRHDTDVPFASGVTALNAAKARDGACICVADGIKLDKPLHILYLNGGGTVHLRSAISVGQGAEVEVVEHFSGVGTEVGVTNSMTDIRLAAGARCEHYRLQLGGNKQYHLGHVAAHQKADSSYTLHAVELGSMLSRVDVVSGLSEQGAATELNGLFVLSGRQHVDHHTRIAHEAPHCRSREQYRTILDGRAHGVFNGKVVVAEGAVKTDSSQSSANLLLSAGAEIDTKPELEIYNDDVKCAHGATVGQLDKHQLFYLRSRGLSEEEAKQLLTFAFADEVLVKMESLPIRRFVECAAFAKLPNIDGIEGLLS